MADTYKKLYQGTVSTASGVAYTVPSGAQTIVKSMRIVNYHASTATTIKLWQGGSDNSNIILPPTTVDAGGFADFDGTLTMAAADTIVAQAGAASSIAVTIYGLELSSAALGSLQLLDSQVFSSSTTYTMPALAKIVVVEMISGAAGGQGGSRQSGTTLSNGGMGGSGTGLHRFTLNSSEITSPVTVTVGAGQAAGIGRTATAGAGAFPVGYGGHSRFGPVGTPGATGFASVVQQRSAVFIAGSTLNGTGGLSNGAGGRGGWHNGGGGGAGGGATAINNAAGAGGSGDKTAEDVFIGGTDHNPRAGNGGAAGTLSGGAGSAGSTFLFGGGGGGSNIAGVGGAGGTGGVGAGGGGGGGANADNNGGNGGVGGAGQISIWVYG